MLINRILGKPFYLILLLQNINEHIRTLFKYIIRVNLEQLYEYQNDERFWTNSVFLCDFFYYDVNTVFPKIHTLSEEGNENNRKNW